MQGRMAKLLVPTAGHGVAPIVGLVLLLVRRLGLRFRRTAAIGVKWLCSNGLREEGSRVLCLESRGVVSFL